MPIIRVTKKQIEEASKAREAALLKDAEFRQREQQRQRLVREVAATKEKGQMEQGQSL
jgi:hypothetical protein